MNTSETHRQHTRKRGQEKMKTADVEKPPYYNGDDVQVIIERYGLGWCLGNVIKYVLRAGKKPEKGLTPKEAKIKDLKKALWYLDREIGRLETDKEYRG